MPRWDDPRGPRHDPERDRWRRGPARDAIGPGRERRAFEPEPADSWTRDRSAQRYPQDQPGYGRGHPDAGSAGYAPRGPGLGSDLSHGGEPYAYGGQEYGVESYGSHAGRSPGWGFERDAERRRGFDFDDPGVGQSQAGYAAETRSHSEQDFDPDYLRWRDEQLRAHDRDYEAWRRQQHRQYDEQYRQFLSERQRHFGQAFHEWRSQRSALGGAPDAGVAPGVSGYGDKAAMPGGYNAPGAYDKPSGFLDPPGHISTDPALSQRSGSGGPYPAGQVQATSDGGVQGRGDPLKDDDSAKDSDPPRH